MKNHGIYKRKAWVKIKSPSQNRKKKMDYAWLFKMAFLTFILSAFFAVASSAVMEKINILFSFIVLFLIIIIGVFFDIIGVAATSADSAPFHSMASHGIKNASIAVEIINSKEKFANFCNDVIGDTCGIISGYTCTALITNMLRCQKNKNQIRFIVDILVTAAVAAITVGGRSAGKNYAIKNCNNIVYYSAKFLSFLKTTQKNKKNRKKK